MNNQIELGGKTYELPPLPLIKAYLLERTRTENSMSEDATKALSEMIFYSLRRKYPDITLEQVENDLDIVNIPKIIVVFRNVNMLTNKEGGASGEALAVS